VRHGVKHLKILNLKFPNFNHKIQYFFSKHYYLEFNRLKPSGHYMYHQFSIQQFYVLPSQFICVFCVNLRKKTAIVSLYNINWLVFVTEF